MAEIILKNVKVKGEITDIEIADGKIRKIGKSSLPGKDMKGMNAYPGLIDIHTHGCLGHETDEPSYLQKMSTFMASHGVTSWYPTLATSSFETMKELDDYDITKRVGANILGFHFEGPYISMKYKGAQNPDYIKNPDLNEFKKFKNVKIITIAPELPNSAEFIENCGAKVVIGHTTADFETAKKAINLGANCVTHIFNAMPPMHHREPSVVGAAFNEQAFVQVICDGFHIHWAVLKMLYKLFGTERMIIISDSTSGAYAKDGEYMSCGQKIYVKDGRSLLPNGTIAGSTTCLFDGVKNLIKYGISQEDAFKMASETPASYMDLNKGRIEEGYDADLIIVDDKLNIKQTIIDGEYWGA
ncbi:MAG: N-acetylglucosamine-6-phosphate deacetylase [Bacillota bacterium]|nr:N-acetylglucosamine-6-phosphate deacetylase [Bacillota bacterium]